MRTIIIAALVAGAVAAYGYSFIYFDDGFYVWYTGFESVQEAQLRKPINIIGVMRKPPGVCVAGPGMPIPTSYVFHVDSLADIRPTPAEMEGK